MAPVTPGSPSTKPSRSGSVFSPASTHVALQALVDAIGRQQKPPSSKLGHSVIFKPDGGADLSGWVKTLCSWTGRPLAPIAAPLLSITFVAFVKVALSQTELFCDGGCPLDFPTLGAQYQMLSIPISFLLVYRLNRVAVRFYESRASFGRIIEYVRTLAGQAVVYTSHDPVACYDLCRWVLAFPIATRNYLRGLPPDKAELRGILSQDEVEAMGNVKMQPMLCQHRMRLAVRTATRSNQKDDSHSVAADRQAMERSIATLNGAWGAMERINATPLPFAYVAHLRLFLVLFLLGMPFVYGDVWQWATPVMTFLLSFGLLGIEGAAVACERPFGLGSNHLPLDLFCSVAADNVAEILRNYLDCEEFEAVQESAGPADSSASGGARSRRTDDGGAQGRRRELAGCCQHPASAAGCLGQWSSNG